jgi:hypothetical protein
MTMPVIPYLFTYDLVKQKDYPALWDELKRLSAHRAMASVWLVAVPKTADELNVYFRSFVDKDDKTFVLELTSNNARTMTYKGTSDWIKANPPRR